MSKMLGFDIRSILKASQEDYAIKGNNSWHPFLGAMKFHPRGMVFSPFSKLGSSKGSQKLAKVIKFTYAFIKLSLPY
jgi:hypothetical protein